MALITSDCINGPDRLNAVPGHPTGLVGLTYEVTPPAAFVLQPPSQPKHRLTFAAKPLPAAFVFQLLSRPRQCLFLRSFVLQPPSRPRQCLSLRPSRCLSLMCCNRLQSTALSVRPLRPAIQAAPPRPRPAGLSTARSRSDPRSDSLLRRALRASSQPLAFRGWVECVARRRRGMGAPGRCDGHNSGHNMPARSAPSAPSVAPRVCAAGSGGRPADRLAVLHITQIEGRHKAAATRVPHAGARRARSHAFATAVKHGGPAVRTASKR